MAAILTNRGKKLILEWALQDANEPSSFYLALLQVGASISVDTNILSDTDEIDTGNGYDSGGIPVARSVSELINLTEDDANDKATIEIDEQVFVTDGGTIPSGGADIRYMALLGSHATPANREVIAIFDLGSDIVIADGKHLAVSGETIVLSTP